MGEEYDSLKCAKVRYDNCLEGDPYGGFLYNKRIIKRDGEKFVFVIDNSMPVSSGELLFEQVAK